MSQQREAALARWKRTKEQSKDWYTMELAEAERKLADLRKQAEEGAVILQQRLATERAKDQIKCVICDATIIPGRHAMQSATRDPHTGVLYNIFYCSQRCVAVRNKRGQAERLGKDELPLESALPR
jgi:hypothetical protein